MGKKSKKESPAGRIIRRVMAALVVGAGGAIVGGFHSGDYLGDFAMIGFAVGCLVGALLGLKALDALAAL